MTFAASFKEKMKKSATERDWPEDFDHENGMYFNRCVVCGHEFMGYKHRIMCKRCSSKEVSYAAS